MKRTEITEPLSGETAALDTEAHPPPDRPAAPGESETRPLERSDGGPGPPAAGLVLERYRLRSRLGAGGFGVVWAADDEKLERQVAVKVIARDARPGGERAEAATARAEREARVAARLNHPGIVALYELGADDAAVYLVSELVHGRTLAEIDRAGALSDQDVARIGAALCDALAHAHAKGVVHRDVKPQNVIVVAEPAAGAGFAKLTDFGIAHLADADPLTRTGDVVGTLAYMAPEQAEGRIVGPPADVYSLALTLYEGWTGTNPVRGASPADTARRLGGRLPPLRARRRDLPARLGQVIDAALDADPERRPTLAVLHDALAEAADALSDEGGLVEPGTLERLGIAGPQRPAPDRCPGAAPAADGHERALGRRTRPLDRLDRGSASLAGRVGAGLAAGGLALAALALLGPRPPVSPLALAAALALAVALLPRAAWLAGALALVAWLAASGREGSALLVAAAALPTPLLLPRAAVLWSVPALAPALGTAGLAPVFVAVAGLVPGGARRVGLAIAGFLWLAVAEAAGAGRLLFGLAGHGHPGAVRSSASAAAHALAPLLTSAALAPAVVWAAFAATLPLAVRGRSLALDVVRGGAWAVGLVAAHAALGRLLPATFPHAVGGGVVAGSALAALLALAVVTLRRPNPALEGRLDAAPVP